MLRAVLAVCAMTLVACGSAGATSEPTTATGMRIAGIDVGGLPISQAAGRLEAAFGPTLRSTIEVRVGAHRLHLTAAGR